MEYGVVECGVWSVWSVECAVCGVWSGGLGLRSVKEATGRRARCAKSHSRRSPI